MSPEVSAEIRGGHSLRKRFSPVAAFVAEKLDDIAPEVTPTHLSVAGVALTLAGLYEASRGRTKSAAVLLVAGNAVDAFDGASSEIKNRRNPGSWDANKGLKIDSACDTVKELSMGFAKILHSENRDDRVGKIFSSLATITSPLSSTLRARADSQSEPVAETGNNPLEFFGTRTGRTIANIAANVAPKSVRTERVADSLITGGNLANIRRYRPKSKSYPPIDKHQERARFRTRFHASVFVATTAGVLALNHHRK